MQSLAKAVPPLVAKAMSVAAVKLPFIDASTGSAFSMYCFSCTKGKRGACKFDAAPPADAAGFRVLRHVVFRLIEVDHIEQGLFARVGLARFNALAKCPVATPQ